MLSKINPGDGSPPRRRRTRIAVNVGLIAGGAGYAPALYLAGLPAEVVTAAVVVATPLFIEAFRRNNRTEPAEDTSPQPESPGRGTTVPVPRQPQTDTPASVPGTATGGDSGPAQ